MSITYHSIQTWSICRGMEIIGMRLLMASMGLLLPAWLMSRTVFGWARRALKNSLYPQKIKKNTSFNLIPERDASAQYHIFGDLNRGQCRFLNQGLEYDPLPQLWKRAHEGGEHFEVELQIHGESEGEEYQSIFWSVGPFCQILCGYSSFEPHISWFV